MNFSKKRRITPLFKKFHKLRENIQNRKKVVNFKKNKWKDFIKFYSKNLQKYHKFKPSDHSKYFLTKYGTKGTGYKKKFRDQLNVSQILRLFYGGLGKKYLKGKIKLTKKKKKFNSKIVLLELFERRLDTVLYKSKFSTSIKEAGQLILHGKVFVNKKQLKSKAYLLKHGDIVSLDKSYLNFNTITKLIEFSTLWPLPPKYLLINYKTMQILFFNNIKFTNLSTLYLFNLRLQKIINNYIKQQ